MTSDIARDILVDGHLNSGQAVTVRVSAHAIQRYRERVRELPEDQIADELNRLFALCPIKPGSPTWTPGTQRPLMHLAVGGTVMIALDPDPLDQSRLLARTTLCTGAFSRRTSRSRRRRTR
ncbi:hypothetical protein GKE82_26220 [Conexibacter sp. W3-3-2]|uniref:hypothetical protein n=1 Tax=Conexibacter sp. W3-3-2 TaxID=2675227 RepID=UPI0012B82B46|nr:hypothetical protein [Conexibacter sp. W3-3-2]MTD47617.1 hypothetical protein [Conexibacter sp. W3-3-2]MTD47702.1 hypothetical protein [Conexibacter sp. W3-3-2]